MNHLFGSRFPRAAVVACLLVVGCRDRATAPEPIDAIQLSAPSGELEVGDSVRVSAVALGESGEPLSGRRFTWVSSDTLVATVDSTGMVTAAAPGAAVIRASAEGRSGELEVRVLDAPPAVQISATVTIEGTDPVDGYPTSTLHVRGTAPGAVRLVYYFSDPGLGDTAPVEIPLTGDPEEPAFDVVVPNGWNLFYLRGTDARGRSTTQEYPFLYMLLPQIRVVSPEVRERFVGEGTAEVRLRLTASAAQDLAESAEDSITRILVGVGGEPETVIPIEPDTAVTFDWTAPLPDTITELWVRAETRAGHSQSVPVVIAHTRPPESAGSYVQVTGNSCALNQRGQAYCWGRILDAGAPRAVSPRVPEPIQSPVTFTHLTGKGPTCGLTPDGTAYCWGYNFEGELGDGTHVARATAAPVGRDLRFQRLVAGLADVCGITAGGEAYCWGDNEYGQADGADPSGDVTTPARVAPDLHFVDIAPGGRHTCGVTSEGTTYCWGDNGQGQLGLGTSGPAPVRSPSPVAGDVRFVDVEAGLDETCALTADGVAYCWGQIAQCFGIDTLPCGEYRVPRAVPTEHRFVSLDVQPFRACGVTSSGEVYCWKSLGQAPEAVAASYRFASFGIGDQFMCGVLPNGAAYCWGRGGGGQLGNGTRYDVTEPVRVLDRF